MIIRWKLRMAAAQRELQVGTQLWRLLADKVGLELSAASVSALFTKEPGQVELKSCESWERGEVPPPWEVCRSLTVSTPPVTSRPVT